MKTGLFVTLCALLAACSSDSIPRNTGVFMLVDTSGTYTEELTKAEQIIRYTLSRLDATDSFAVARIDTGSFSEKDIVANTPISRVACCRLSSFSTRRALARKRS